MGQFITLVNPGDFLFEMLAWPCQIKGIFWNYFWVSELGKGKFLFIACAVPIAVCAGTCVCCWLNLRATA